MASIVTNLRAATLEAPPASRFLNSLGVNSSISRRGESLKETVKVTRHLGIRWFRCGYEGGLPVDDLLELHQQTGARFSYGLLSGGNDLERLLEGARRLAQADALLALEGPNEPNNWRIQLQGDIQTARLFKPQEGTESHEVQMTDGELSLNLSNEVAVLEFRRLNQR